MISSSLQANSAPTVRWGICRNVLLGLIGLQLLILAYIGFSAPSVTDHFLDSLRNTTSTHQGEEADEDLEEEPPSSLVTQPHNPNNNKNKQRSDGTTRDRGSLVGRSTGPFDIPGAFFANYELERLQPAFRNQRLAQTTDELVHEIRQLSNSNNNNKIIKACFYYQNNRILYKHDDEACQPGGQQKQQQQDNEYIVYNSLKSMDRIWCGQTVPAGSYIVAKEICDMVDPTRLFPQSSLPVVFRRVGSDAPLTTLESCDVPCQVTMDVCPQGRGPDCLPATSQWTLPNADWTFTYIVDAPGLRPDRKAYRYYQFTASQSFSAEVPLSYFSWEKHGHVIPDPVDYDQAEKGVSFLTTPTCRGPIQASAWAKAIQKILPLASYAHCVHTTNPPHGMSLQNPNDRKTLLQKHLFTLIVEPSLENDLVSEAVWEALSAGVIPVYYGAGNIEEHVPPNSIVNGAQVGTKSGTAELVQRIANDRGLWESYHAWRKPGQLPPALADKFAFLKTDPYCRVCRWAHAATYGLGWNHTTQAIQEPAISRQPCFDNNNGLLTRPFRESWFLLQDNQDDGTEHQTVSAGSCNNNDERSVRVVESTNYRVERTVVSHDGGVVDVVVTKAHSQKRLVLRMEVPIRNWDGAHFRDVHRLLKSPHVAMASSVAVQDSSSRVTVVTNWPATIACPTNGIIEVVVHDDDNDNDNDMHQDETRRIRVITEDVDSVRDVVTEYNMSPYARAFLQDLVEPLAVFATTS